MFAGGNATFLASSYRSFASLQSQCNNRVKLNRSAAGAKPCKKRNKAHRRLDEWKVACATPHQRESQLGGSQSCSVGRGLEKKGSEADGVLVREARLAAPRHTQSTSSNPNFFSCRSLSSILFATLDDPHHGKIFCCSCFRRNSALVLSIAHSWDIFYDR